jgi:hypothetical protein
MNPWAWIGIAAIGVPIAIHMLARQVTSAVPFPTLRFLRASAVIDVRRRRLTDLFLLALRILIVASAVSALARPFMRMPAAASIDRIAIIDASASVPLESARAAAKTLADGAADFLVIERRDLGLALVEAAAWLGARDGRGEVVVVSDFQRGALPAAALEALPGAAGVTMVRVDANGAGTPAIAGVAEWSAAGNGTAASWTGGDAPAGGLEIIGAPGGDRVADAIATAAARTARGWTGRIRPAMFVLPDAPGRAALHTASTPIDEPWMFDVWKAIGDSAIVSEVRAVTRGDARVPVFFLDSRDAAAIAGAIADALPVLAGGVPLPELEPARMSDGELRAMERPAGASGPGTRAAAWAGRWFWLAALLLLAVETLVRRGRETNRELAEERAHAA